MRLLVFVGGVCPSARGAASGKPTPRAQPHPPPTTWRQVSHLPVSRASRPTIQQPQSLPSAVLIQQPVDAASRRVTPTHKPSGGPVPCSAWAQRERRFHEEPSHWRSAQAAAPGLCGRGFPGCARRYAGQARPAHPTPNSARPRGGRCPTCRCVGRHARPPQSDHGHHDAPSSLKPGVFFAVAWAACPCCMGGTPMPPVFSPDFVGGVCNPARPNPPQPAQRRDAAVTKSPAGRRRVAACKVSDSCAGGATEAGAGRAHRKLMEFSACVAALHGYTTAPFAGSSRVRRRVGVSIFLVGFSQA